MHPIYRSEYFEPMSFFYGGISCFFHMNKDFFYWKTEKMPLENLWQFQKQNFEEIFKKHPLIVYRNNNKYVKSIKKQLSKLLKLSSHPTQYLTLSLSKNRVAKKKKSCYETNLIKIITKNETIQRVQKSVETWLISIYFSGLPMENFKNQTLLIMLKFGLIVGLICQIFWPRMRNSEIGPET